MDGDSFADPRRRSNRGRGRGRGRGTRGGRVRGGGALQKRPGPSRAKGPELGSNAYRFSEPDEDAGEEFDAGVDFDDAAAASMADDPLMSGIGEEHDGAQLTAELGGMVKSLESVPLWVRLGEVSRFALGVADEDVIENYLEPFENEDGDGRGDGKGVGAQFAEELARLTFDEEEDDGINESAAVPQERGSREALTGTSKVSGKEAPLNEQVSAEDRDDFDKWLDDV